MRNGNFFGAAVWDGCRIQTLEGFGTAVCPHKVLPNISPCMQERRELAGLFSSFGQHATLLQLLPEAYASHGLLGAVIENSGFFGAAVWDGRRIHTLEGFGTAGEAEASARDVLAMIGAIHSGHGQDLLSILPMQGDPVNLGEQDAANGQQAPRPLQQSQQQQQQRHAHQGNYVPRWGHHSALKPGRADLSSPLTMHMQEHDGFVSCAAVRSDGILSCALHTVSLPSF
jgi:hypothetical protein